MLNAENKLSILRQCQLLGVNTAVVHAGAVGTELFGAALSGHLVKDEFGQLIGAAKPPE